MNADSACRVQVDPPTDAPPRDRCGIRAVLVEGGAVMAVGVLLAGLLNTLSPRGLNLARDYFPGAVRIALPPQATSNRLAGDIGGTNVLSPTGAQLTMARLKAKNLQIVGIDRVQQLFHDPRFQQHLVVMVDARDDAHYQAGHIPGAYQLDHYRAPDYLGSVLPVCLTAEQVIVYCLGGDCEDSEFTAALLRDAGVPNEKLAVYVGGFTEWSTNGLPIEIGNRGSGALREEKK